MRLGKMAILVTGGLGFVGSHFVWTARRAGRDRQSPWQAIHAR